MHRVNWKRALKWTGIGFGALFAVAVVAYVISAIWPVIILGLLALIAVAHFKAERMRFLTDSDVARRYAPEAVRTSPRRTAVALFVASIPLIVLSTALVGASEDDEDAVAPAAATPTTTSAAAQVAATRTQQPTPTATPRPTAMSTPEPTATASPSPTTTPEPTPTTEPTHTPVSPTATPVPPTSTPEPTPTVDTAAMETAFRDTVAAQVDRLRAAYDTMLGVSMADSLTKPEAWETLDGVFAEVGEVYDEAAGMEDAGRVPERFAGWHETYVSILRDLDAGANTYGAATFTGSVEKAAEGRSKMIDAMVILDEHLGTMPG